MIFSMTAFARRQLDEDWGSLIWEIRSVNHRYLENSIRLPDMLRSLEPAIRDAVRKKLSRGKVECQLRYQPGQQLEEQLHLNSGLIGRLGEASQTVQQLTGDAQKLTVAEILRWPGVILERDTNIEELEEKALQLFNTAIDELLTNRNREGEELGRMIEQRLQGISDIVSEVRSLMPEIMQRQRANIIARLDELKPELDANRLEQELVLLAQKSDVDEELDRLDSHVKEVSRILKASGQKGRRLDFLMQELNREANTLSSKSVVAETTRNAVELKVLIEQMREQIQNIE